MNKKKNNGVSRLTQDEPRETRVEASVVATLAPSTLLRRAAPPLPSPHNHHLQLRTLFARQK